MNQRYYHHTQCLRGSSGGASTHHVLEWTEVGKRCYPNLIVASGFAPGWNYSLQMSGAEETELRELNQTTVERNR